MAEPKTKRNDGSVEAFLGGVEDEKRRTDALAVLELMRKATGEEPTMWGGSIVGFGSYTCTYANGRTGEWPLTGFSPRKQALTLYVMSGFDRFEELTARLGKFRTGKSCLYLNRLEDVDRKVLEELVKRSVAHVRKRKG